MPNSAAQPEENEGLEAAIDRAFMPFADNDNGRHPPLLVAYRQQELDSNNNGIWSPDGSMLRGVRIDDKTGDLYVHTNGQILFKSAGQIYNIKWDPLPVICPWIWQGVPVPPRQWFIPDLVPMNTVTILNGDGGVGKSLLALQLAAAAAMSVDTLNLEPWEGNAIYVGAEDDDGEFHRRLADIAVSLGGDMSDLYRLRVVPLADRDALLCTFDKEGRLKETDLWKQIKRLAYHRLPRLIVLDTAADLYGGDEIKRGQVRQFIAMLRKVAIELECAIILLAHPSVQGMQTGSGSSGSTAWNNSVRSRLYMTKGGPDDDSDLRILKTMKANYGKTGDEIKLRWKDGAFVLDDGKPSAASGLIQAHHEQVFLRLLSEINRSGRRVAETKGTNYAPVVLEKMPGAEGIKKKDFEAAMNRLFTAGEIKVEKVGPPSNQRKQLVVIADEIAAGRMEAD
ncbi:AAA family ATPase [Ochrobactrum sp. CM-21-5]|nr:AAA family ATPase [Ochrobactrum sp. CM-21-5]MBC2884317.1 AAA family ATPase [Ochrobactrum sp. CM-21-5]